MKMVQYFAIMLVLGVVGCGTQQTIQTGTQVTKTTNDTGLTYTVADPVDHTKENQAKTDNKQNVQIQGQDKKDSANINVLTQQDHSTQAQNQSTQNIQQFQPEQAVQNPTPTPTPTPTPQPQASQQQQVQQTVQKPVIHYQYPVLGSNLNLDSATWSKPDEISFLKQYWKQNWSKNDSQYGIEGKTYQTPNGNIYHIFAVFGMTNGNIDSKRIAFAINHQISVSDSAFQSFALSVGMSESDFERVLPLAN